MYMQKLVKEAKKFAGIKPDTIIDEEEKYYNRGAVEKYEAFLAGANCAYNEFINKACEWLKFHVSVPYEGETTENGDIPAKEYLDWAKKRLEATEKICNDFVKQWRNDDNFIIIFYSYYNNIYMLLFGYG